MQRRIRLWQCKPKTDRDLLVSTNFTTKKRPMLLGMGRLLGGPEKPRPPKAPRGAQTPSRILPSGPSNFDNFFVHTGTSLKRCAGIMVRCGDPTEQERTLSPMNTKRRAADEYRGDQIFITGNRHNEGHGRLGLSVRLTKPALLWARPVSWRPRRASKGCSTLRDCTMGAFQVPFPTRQKPFNHGCRDKQPESEQRK